ncbi:Hint domain-containing protein [Thalassobius sp. I31.1]|uniref:Hint domain-containing protein n=1 Tax=Thalassobius sp. I31.1 TaxID=2109912 RepID=UPI000D1A36A8|nr:Hint domain-containing protein [Thalassobius sp. I31.1]
MYQVDLDEGTTTRGAFPATTAVELTNVEPGVTTNNNLYTSGNPDWPNNDTISIDGEVTYADGTKSTFANLRGIKLQDGSVIIVRTVAVYNTIHTSGIDGSKSIAQLNLSAVNHSGSSGVGLFYANSRFGVPASHAWESVMSDRPAFGSPGGGFPSSGFTPGTGPGGTGGTGGGLCFVAGTKIQTVDGHFQVEDLEPGTLVLTKDNGFQPVRWIGSATFPAKGHIAPILIRKGTLNNFADLCVSPQHRVLLTGWQAELLFGEREVLVAAKALLNDSTVLQVEGGDVHYFHVMFDNHEIIFSNGAETESFNPGKESFKTLDAGARAEILELFPQLEAQESFRLEKTARCCIKSSDGALFGQYLAARQDA